MERRREERYLLLEMLYTSGRRPYPVALVGLILLVLCSGTIVAGGSASRGGESPGPVWVVSRGNSGDRYAAVYVIRSEAELHDAPIPGELKQEAAAGIDFTRQAAIVFFAGTRATGGYRLDPGNIRKTERELVISITETPPDPDTLVTQALTYPYILLGVHDPPPSIVIEGPAGR